MTIAEEMLAKAGVKTEEQPAGTPAESAGNAINSQGGTESAGEKKDAINSEQQAAGAPPEEKKTEPVDPTKDGTVTVKDLTPPAEPATPPDASAASPAAPAGSEDEIEEARVRAYLSKKAGKEITSLDEILNPKKAEDITEEEKQKLQEKFQNDAIRYGLDKELFTPKVLEAFNVDRAKTPREIALRVFTDEQLAMDPTLAEQLKTNKAETLEMIEERFQDAFFEHEEEDDWRRVRGQASIKQIAEGYIYHKYGSVINATEAFEAEINTQQYAEAYRGKVEKVISELPQFLKITIEGKEFSYQVPETSRKNLREQFLKEETFARMGSGAVEEADLRLTMDMALSRQEHDKFVSEVCKAYAASQILDIKMGRKNIPVTSEPSGTMHNGETSTGKKSMAEVLLEKAMIGKTPVVAAKP